MPEPSELCRRFAATPSPPADFASESERAALRGCDAEALYYGLEVGADFVRARQCAFETRRAPGMPPDVHAGILMMLYANGLGVPPNYDLALRFACEWADNPDDPESLAQLLGTLWGAKTGSQPLQKKLDECDVVSSGTCTLLAMRMADVTRAARERAVTGGMPSHELKALKSAAEHYIQLRTGLELTQSGPMAARRVVEEAAGLRDGLVDALEKLHDAAFAPKATDSKSIDAEMVGQLRQIDSCRWLAPGPQVLPGAVTRVGVQRTQLAWKAYRDAFVALALAVRPKTAASDWQAWLGEARLAQLRDLSAGC